MVVPSHSASRAQRDFALSSKKLILLAGIFIAILEPEFVSSQSMPDFKCIVQCGKYTTFLCPFTDSSLETGFADVTFEESRGLWYQFHPYTNVSFTVPRDNRSIIQILNTSDGTDIKYRQIDLSAFTSPTSEHINLSAFTSPTRELYPTQCTVRMSYLPFENQRFKIRKMKPINRSFISEDRCNTLASKNQCSILSRSSVIMKPKQTSIELDLWNAGELEGLKVELVGRPCWSKCSDVSPSCVSNLTTVRMANPKAALLIQDLSPAFYCARVIYAIGMIDCCSIYTGTISLLFAQHIPHTPQNYHRTSYFYYTCLYGVVLVCIAVCLHLRFKTKRVVVYNYSYTSAPTDKLNELSCITPISQYEYSSKDICLIYPKTEGSFMAAMSSFRTLLSNYARKVWDPLDENEVENVIANPARWIQKVLAIPDVKLVFVETEEAINWSNSKDRTVDIDNEDLYFYVLSLIMNQPALIYNYRRLHVVRFKTIKIGDDSSLSLVPQKRYQMPHQLGLLIMDLIDTEWSYELVLRKGFTIIRASFKYSGAPFQTVVWTEECVNSKTD